MKLSHLSLIACLFMSGQALALSTDQKQPVYIDSDSQQLDMQSNQVTFLGDVKLKQGSININAEKIIVTRDPKDGSIQRIDGFGELATFSQLTDDGKTLYGEAKELEYSLAKDQLTMRNKAMLSQDDSLIRGNQIRYQISSQKLIADGKQKGDRVSTVLQPQAVQE
ncbi:lipopolysaccharide transport periplasmic protein LptA [Vibrio atypicus]|uniref:lipopolysaccharide transport periplasmic protein LptA n=1 Tax=Vibrio atypicus TaxID=558271 RepID=UPI00135A3E20|nr:lipopolysaccharide transport periplasmic protein LptA [Vibrio atypicus]